MSTGTCLNCGAGLPEALGGLCTRCMLKQVMLKDGGEEAGENLPGDSGFMRDAEAGGFGDYELMGEIARGGMGVVYRARQLSLNRVVALKMILSGRRASELEVRRFRMEAEAAANLDHPNIVAIYEVGEHQGQPYFSMRLVEGESLAHLLDQKDWDIKNCRASARVIAKLARAVHCAHQHGILHRDLKPGNILLDHDGEPHVTDFGLAKLLTQDLNLTQTDAVMGTPSYMSPEQAAGGNSRLTTAADVYGCGAILYALLTGHAPFRGASAAETLQQVIERDPVRPGLRNSLVAKDLETICLKCLEKDPQRRYASAVALAEDLDRWSRSEPILARPSTYRDRVVKWCRRKPLIAGLAASLHLVILLGLAGVLWKGHQARVNLAKAVENEQRAHLALAQANLSRAQARRMSGAAGQRVESIRALREARPYYTNVSELRDEAIASLALVDLEDKTADVRLPHPNNQPFELNFALGLTAAAEPDGRIILRSLDNGGLLKVLAALGSPVEKLRFSPKAPVLVAEYGSAAQPRVVAWDWREGRGLFAATQGIHAQAFDFSPDGQLVAIGHADGRLLVYALPGGEIVHNLELRLASGAPRAPQVIRFDPSGALLAESSLDDLYVQVWALGAEKVIARLPHTDVVYDLTWGPNGELLATACRDAHIYVWNTNALTRPWKLAGHEGPVTAVTFNHRGTLMASLGHDETVRLWVPGSGRHMARRLDGENLEALRFSASDQFLIGTGAQQKSSRVWEVLGGEYVVLHPWGGQADMLRTLDFSPDGRWLAAASGKRAVIWDPGSGRESASLRLTNANTARFSADSRRLVASTDKGLFGYPLAQVGKAEEIRAGTNELGSMAITADRRLAAITRQAQVIFVPLEPGTPPNLISLDTGVYHHRIALHPQARWLAGMVGESLSIHVWDLTGKPERRSFVTIPSNKYFTFSPEGKWLVTSWGGKFEFYRVGDWERPAFTIPRKPVSDQHAPVTFTTDGAVVALAGSRYTVQLWTMPPDDRTSPTLLATLESPDRSPLETLVFSPDGSRLAAATLDQTVQLWNLQLLQQQLATWELTAGWELYP